MPYIVSDFEQENISMKRLSSAIDFSTGKLFFAVAEESGKIFIESSLEMKGRDSSKILPWIESQLDKNNCSFSDIKNWTCGMGPGSFTGLRIIAALISGLTFSKNGDSSCLVRGVPSAVAIGQYALRKKRVAKKIAVLYDGRRGEALCYSMKWTGKDLLLPETRELPAVSKDNAAILENFDIMVGMSSEQECFRKVLPDKYLEKIILMNSFPVQQLLTVDNFPWGKKSLLNPVYLRPPVYVEPAKIRKIK